MTSTRPAPAVQPGDTNIDGYVIGCVHAAWKRLGGIEAGVRYIDVHRTYQQHSKDLAKLTGSDRIWKRIMKLHRDQPQQQLDLG